MILHIAPDEKFIDSAYEIFEEAYPENNEFLIVTKNKNFTYIKSTPAKNISQFQLYSKRFASDLTQYEFVVIHWLDRSKMELILNAPTNVKFLWVGWGGDYYSYINKDLFLPKTKELHRKLRKKSTIKQKIKLFIIENIFARKSLNIENIMSRIDYFAPVLSVEYKMVSHSFRNFNPQYIEWNYGFIERNLEGMSDEIVDTNILIGNSATYENNHIEIFDIVGKLKVENRKIIAPLSYGDSDYADYVEQYGQSKFDNFLSLREFMPLNEYNKVISSCPIVIMNHLRQQALGNITTMMYLGAKIFLNKENPVYRYYIDMGLILFSVDELDEKSIARPLSQAEIERNRKILTYNFNHKIMIKKTKTLIDIVNKRV